MRCIVCTAAEDRFLPMALELMRSIRDKDVGRTVDIGLLDLDLSPEHRASAAELADHLVVPGWDVEIRVPAEVMKGITPWHGFRAMTARPFLPKHFPGYDLYLWFDADIWVQQWSAVELFIESARDGALAIVAEIDRSYDFFYDHGKHRAWLYGCYERAYGVEAAKRFHHHPIINSGAFALRGDSPLWAIWGETFQDGLTRTADFSVDQLSLNYVLYTRGVPYRLLPSTANWLVNKAAPCFDRDAQLFTEPAPPYAPLGIVHLSGKSKSQATMVKLVDGSGIMQSWVRYDPLRMQRIEIRTAETAG